MLIHTVTLHHKAYALIRNMCTPAHSCNYPISQSYDSTAVYKTNPLKAKGFSNVYIKHHNIGKISVTVALLMLPDGFV